MEIKTLQNLHNVRQYQNGHTPSTRYFLFLGNVETVAFYSADIALRIVGPHIHPKNCFWAFMERKLWII